MFEKGVALAFPTPIVFTSITGCTRLRGGRQ